jgi:hypothetical protein
LTWAWGLAAAAALLWPARTAGPLDGLPLDVVVEAVSIGIVFPSLLWFHPRFLRTSLAHGFIVALLAWKVFAATSLVPDGWCVRFVPGRPLVSNATSDVPHSWDVRADWLARQPACSAIMRRPYNGLGEFPVWFFNLPAANGMYPVEGDRPPTARTRMTVTGFVSADTAGTMRFVFGSDMRGTTGVFVDDEPAGDETAITPGVHRVRVDSLLVGDAWRFVPLWNGADLWSSGVSATLQRPSRLDDLARPAGNRLVTVLVFAWILCWTLSFLARVDAVEMVAWSAVASAGLGLLAANGLVDAARWGVAALAGAAFLRVPSRHRTLTGAFVLIGIPWLALIVASGEGEIGRFRLYTVGDDYWTFQRNAYRIVLQGYWLEGGSVTFWFQPLYRWIAGVIHLLFGDSSVGERYWDGACLLATALFAWRVADAYAGFRAGIVAAALTLGVLALGTPWALIGQGLGENSSAGFLALAAFAALRSRRGPAGVAVIAGILATLAFYARLNNLPMAIAVAVFALPLRLPVRMLAHVRLSWKRVAWRTAVVVPAVVGVGLLLFAWRTWHYTGIFSLFYGTQRQLLAVWQPGMPAATALLHGLSSAMMVLTVNDPAQFDWRALPVLAGAAAAALAVIGVPRLRDLPAAPTLFFLAGISAAFVARGSAYAGRFSVHIVGVTCALAVCAASSLARPRAGRTPRRSARAATA